MPLQNGIIQDEASDILGNHPDRISDVIRKWSDYSPNRAALVETGGTWTYGQLANVIEDMESWLLHLGIRSGDRVMLVCENCREFVAVLLALARLDAWAVLVNARLSAPEIDQIRDHCGARRVLYMTSVSPHAREHAHRHYATTEDAVRWGPVAVGALNEKVEPEPIESDIPNRVAAVIYTSGTTGLPKGVMLTHRNLLFLAAGSAKIRALTPEDRLYGVLPMFHAVGLSVVLLGTLLSGATLYLSPRFDPVKALATLERDRLTVLLGAPAMFALLLEYTKLKGIRSLKLPALRIIASASAPLQPTLKSAVEGLFGLVLHNGYGVTECSPTIAQTRVEAPRSDTSIGPAFPGVTVKLVGLDHKAVAEGEVGELWVRGPNVMKGYYHAPEETAAAIDAEGWFNTRDLARMENGDLFIVGRTKELIVRFGLNVYPAEIEAVLNAHPAVLRSAVIGRSVGGVEGDEEILAFIQLQSDSTLTTAELGDYAARHLASYKRPSKILLIPAMPLTPTGKVMKDELAKMASLSAQVR